jgi:DSF synthase
MFGNYKRHTMNAFVSPAHLANRDSREIIQYSDGSAQFVVSPQFSCHYDRKESLLWSHWAPQGVPAFSIDLLHGLERGSQMIEGFFLGRERERPLRYIVLRSMIPGVFSVGGDLGYFQRLIAAQDRARLTEYARTAISVQYRNYCSHNLTGVTTVALLEGDALGGGLECALSCDVVIAERHVKAGFPEVLFNMFPGMGGISFLTRRASRAVGEEMVRTGRQYTALELLELGVIDQVVETGEGPDAVHKLVRKREHQHSAHAAINQAHRLVRPVGLQELYDVVKIWVDCALQLSPRSIAWMQRLYQRQLAVFGQPLQLVNSEAPMIPPLDVAVAA